jgi:hypothetical protein
MGLRTSWVCEHEREAARDLQGIRTLRTKFVTMMKTSRELSQEILSDQELNSDLYQVHDT